MLLQTSTSLEEDEDFPKNESQHEIQKVHQRADDCHCPCTCGKWQPTMVNTMVATDDIEMQENLFHDHPYLGKISYLNRMSSPPANCHSSVSDECQVTTDHPSGSETDNSSDVEIHDDKDPDYVPCGVMSDSDSEEYSEEQYVTNDDKYFVFRYQLLKLFKVCHYMGCGKPVISDPICKIKGFGLSIATEFVDGHLFTWMSQWKLKRGLYAGNCKLRSHHT